MDRAANLTKLCNYVSKGKVFIFSKSYCPYCDKAKDLFTDLEVKYGSIEVDKSNDFPSSFVNFLNEHSKIKTYPKIYIGEECIGGYTDVQKMIRNMKLFDKLKAEGISYAEF